MRTFLAAALLLGSVVDCQAQLSSVDMGWSNVVFSLVDLDTADGTSPSFRKLSRRVCYPQPICLNLPPQEPLYQPENPFQTTRFSVTPTNPGDGYEFANSTRFELSPHTRLIVTGTLLADSSGPQSKIVDDIGAGIRYTYTVSAFGTVQAALGAGASDNQAIWASQTGPTSTTFALEIESGDIALFDTFTLTARVTGTSSRTAEPIPAVPEPASYALLGLGAVAVLLRRRLVGASPT
jgi:PEP-CTERM motif